MHISKCYYSQIKNITSLILRYVLVNMSKIIFRGCHLKVTVIHTMSILRVKDSQYILFLFFNKGKNDRFGFLVKLRFQKYEFFENWLRGFRDTWALC